MKQKKKSVQEENAAQRGEIITAERE